MSYVASPPGGVLTFPSSSDGPLPARIDSKHTTVAVGDSKTFLPAYPRFLTRRGCPDDPSKGPIQSVMDDRRQECGGRKRRVPIDFLLLCEGRYYSVPLIYSQRLQEEEGRADLELFGLFLPPL